MIWRTSTNSLSYSGFQNRPFSTRPYGMRTGRCISGVSTLSVRRHDGCRAGRPWYSFNRARLGQAWERTSGRFAHIATHSD